MPYRKSHRCWERKTCSFCAPYGKRQRLQEDARVAEATAETKTLIRRPAMPGNSSCTPGVRDRNIRLED